MRPGLVVAGVALLLLGGGTLLVVHLPSSGPTERDVATVQPDFLGPNSTHSSYLPGTDTASGSFSFRWNATSPLEVRLYRAAGCHASAPGACVVGAPVANWSHALSGTYAAHGALQYPFLLVYADVEPTGSTFRAVAVATSSTPSPPVPLATTLLLNGGGAALLVLGAISVFLGLFLRGGFLQRPAPLVSRSADDAAALASDRRDESPPTAPRKGS